MKDLTEFLSELSAPFEDSCVEIFTDGEGNDYPAIRVRHKVDRLNAVFGIGNWKLDMDEYQNFEQYVQVRGRLVAFPNHPLGNLRFGDNIGAASFGNDLGNAPKLARTSLLARCCDELGMRPSERWYEEVNVKPIPPRGVVDSETAVEQAREKAVASAERAVAKAEDKVTQGIDQAAAMQALTSDEETAILDYLPGGYNPEEFEANYRDKWSVEFVAMVIDRKTPIDVCRAYVKLSGFPIDEWSEGLKRLSRARIVSRYNEFHQIDQKSSEDLVSKYTSSLESDEKREKSAEVEKKELKEEKRELDQREQELPPEPKEETQEAEPVDQEAEPVATDVNYRSDSPISDDFEVIDLMNDVLMPLGFTEGTYEEMVKPEVKSQFKDWIDFTYNIDTDRFEIADLLISQ